MAQITTVSIVSTGWTRVDSLASHTYIEVSSRDDTQRIGLKIAASDPGAGVAYDSGNVRLLQPGAEWPMRLGTSDQVWARAETGATSLDVSEAT